MKKSTLRVLTLCMLLSAVMFNCKKDEDKFPTEPDTEKTEELKNLDVVKPTYDQPAAVEVKESSVEVSAKTAEVTSGLNELANGTVAPSVSAAADEVSAALSASEIATLNSVSAETIAKVSAGGALPADLKAVMDKVANDPNLKAYLPTFTLPSVGGVQISGARTGSDKSVDAVQAITVDDNCIAKAEAAFATSKAKLDATKATYIAEIAAAYTAYVAPLAAQETQCVASVAPKYAALRTAAAQIAATANAVLDAAQGLLGARYAILKALVNIQLLGYLSTLNTLQVADTAACAAKTTAYTNAAAAVRASNTAKVEAAYATALASATEIKAALIASCHNQGSGN